MKILCIGEALIDMICTDIGKSLTEGNSFLKKAGGAPSNVAAAVAALGGDVELVAKVGDDPFGNHLLEVMHSFGVGTRYIFKDNIFFTTLAFVSLLESGERDFYFNRGADGQLNRQEVEDLDLSAFGIAHFGSATAFLEGPLQTAYDFLLDRCLEHNVFVSFDPNYRQLLFGNNKQYFIDRSWEYLMRCNFFKLSDEEAIMITGLPTVEEAALTLLERTTATFAITLGKDGTLLGYKNSTYIIPSIPVKPVDTTGAGDAFVGAVLKQLSDKPANEIADLTVEEWKTIVTNANKAGARTCEYMGAMEAFKHLSNDIFQ